MAEIALYVSDTNAKLVTLPQKDDKVYKYLVIEVGGFEQWIKLTEKEYEKLKKHGG